MTRIDPRTVTRTLDGLGEDPKSVALTLMSENTRGMRHRSNSCPVANYLTQHYGGEWAIEGDWGCQWPEDQQPGDDFEVPYPVAVFVAEFDSGNWPQLEEKS